MWLRETDIAWMDGRPEHDRARFRHLANLGSFAVVRPALPRFSGLGAVGVAQSGGTGTAAAHAALVQDVAHRAERPVGVYVDVVP
jgi:hypothetical protein